MEARKWKGKSDEICIHFAEYAGIYPRLPKSFGTDPAALGFFSWCGVMMFLYVSIFYQDGTARPLELRLLHMHIVWKTLSIVSTFSFGSLWHPKKCSVPSLDKPLCKMHMYVIPLATLSTFSTLPPWCPFQSVEILMSCCCLPLVVPGIFATSRTC